MRNLCFLLFCIFASNVYAFGFKFNLMRQKIEVKNFGTYSAYQNGTFARNCNEYKNPIDSVLYKSANVNGVYRVKPSAAGAFDTYCDMIGGVWDNFSGGYTLVGRFNATLQSTPVIRQDLDGSNLGYLTDSKYQSLLAISSNIYHRANSTIVIKTAKSILPFINCYKNDTTAYPEILGGTTFLWFHSENSGCTASGGDHSEVYFSLGSAIVFSSNDGFSSYWTSGTTFQTDSSGYDIRKTFDTYSSSDIIYMYVK